MNKSIIVILNRLVVGGQTLDTLPLLNKLSNHFSITVLHGRKEKDEQEAASLLKQFPALKSQYISSLRRSINIFSDVAAFMKIYKIIKKQKPHIVHTHGSKSGMIGRFAAYMSGVPVIIHTFHGHLFHSYYNRVLTSFVKTSERSMSRITTTAIAISEWQKKELSEVYKIYNSKKIEVIHLGVETDKINKHAGELRNEFRKQYNLCEKVVAIALVGRLVPIKNADMFIHAAKELLLIIKQPVCFFVVGDGYLKSQLQQMCSQLNLSWSDNKTSFDELPNVIFTSWMEDALPAFHGLDILALTSHNEGTPMSIIEAQACGKPVVATNVGGVRDTLIHGETGFLIPPGNKKEFIRKLQLLIKDEALREKMGARATEFAAAHFSKQQEVNSYRNLYNSYF